MWDSYRGVAREQSIFKLRYDMRKGDHHQRTGLPRPTPPHCLPHTSHTNAKLSSGHMDWNMNFHKGITIIL